VQRAAHHGPGKRFHMRRKAAETTSAEFGFRHCGMAYWDWTHMTKVKEDKYQGRQVTGRQLLGVLGRFFNQSPDQAWPLQGPWRSIVDKALAEVETLRGLIGKVEGLRFWGASLLLVLDGDAVAKQNPEKIVSSFSVKLIDFSNSEFIG
ncbi:unnamed protein product, partial [Effrenium voratum]